MNPRPDNGLSWEDRVARMPDAQGGFTDFDYDAIEVVEQVEDLVRRFGPLGMTPALAGEVQPMIGPGSESEGARAGVLIREILEIIICAPGAFGPRLAAEQLRLAFGFRNSNKESVRGIAKRYGLTPAAVSKAVLDLQRRLNLPKNSFNKTAAACEVYALTNKPSRAK